MGKTELHLSIISADRKIFVGKIATVMLPGTAGGFSIHPDHAPFVSSLRAGKIVYVTLDNKTTDIQIKGGFIDVNNNIVTVCVE